MVAAMQSPVTVRLRASNLCTQKISSGNRTGSFKMPSPTHGYNDLEPSSGVQRSTAPSQTRSDGTHASCKDIEVKRDGRPVVVKVRHFEKPVWADLAKKRMKLRSLEIVDYG